MGPQFAERNQFMHKAAAVRVRKLVIEKPTIFGQSRAEKPGVRKSSNPGAQYALQLDLSVEARPNRFVHIPGSLVVDVDGKGNAVAAEMMTPNGPVPVESLERGEYGDPDTIVLDTVFPALYTMFLLGHTNVKARTVDAPTQQRSKPHAGKRGVSTPKDTYRVVDVKSIDRFLTQYLASDETTRSEFALHGVRGHYKTFAGERLLFGKHGGRYFWGPQIRGSASKGTVTKDYAVQSPVEGGTEPTGKGASFGLVD